jgi:uncharacterized protein (DUF1800 family)
MSAIPRRTALKSCALLVALAGCESPPRPAGPPATASDDALWLDRLSWGATAPALTELRRLGRRAWLDEQLRPGPAAWPAPLADTLGKQRIAQQTLPALVAELETQRKAADALKDDAAKAAAQQAYQQDLTRLAREAAARQLLLACYSPRQLQEQLTWFWFNHFNVHQYKHNLRVMVGDYEQGLRERAVGRFRDLLGFTVHHPAMLRYLDNEQNAAGRINENYARELLELHTLGVDGGYSQRDVQELARVLTGLGVNLTGIEPKLKPALQAQYRREGLTEFNPARHDFGDKQLLGLQLKGRGFAEVDEVLDHLARQPATARFVCRKLAQYFVADAPPPALIERMSQAWQRHDGRIGEVIRAMVEAPEFEASLGRKFKDPVHYVVSAVRLAYGDKLILNTAPMQGWLYRLGQGLYNRQTPDGYPLDESAWAGPGQMGTRFEIARAIGSGSAGLFRIEGEKQDKPAFPQLANPLYFEGMAPRLAASTRQTLDQAGSPQEWNTLLLASPEFMQR